MRTANKFEGALNFQKELKARLEEINSGFLPFINERSNVGRLRIEKVKNLVFGEKSNEAALKAVEEA